MLELFDSKIGMLVMRLLIAWKGEGLKTKAQRRKALERFVTLKVLAHCLRAIRDEDLGTVPDDLLLTTAGCTAVADAADALAIAA